MKYHLLLASLGGALIALNSPVQAADKAASHDAHGQEHGKQHDMGMNSARIGDIAIMNAWAREGTKSAPTGAAYLTLMNEGAHGDKLIAAATPAAGKTELHNHIEEGGVMKMRQVEAIELPAGETVELARGGLHVMLFGLTGQLVEGASFPLTLTFEQAGEVEVTVQVEDIAHQPAGGAHKH